MGSRDESLAEESRKILDDFNNIIEAEKIENMKLLEDKKGLNQQPLISLRIYSCSF